MLITLPNAFGDAPTNMAIDAALLETLPEGLAAFRHYGWVEPAITFGYTQKFAFMQEASATPEASYCRRLTGGGIVDHRNDWTYALIIQTDLPAAHTPANDLYTLIHQAIQAALSTQHIESQLAPCPRQCGEAPAAPSKTASQCFVTPAASDVLQPSGRKIAGAAMKRSKAGLLVQGSIDRASLPETFDYEAFKLALIDELSVALDIPIGTVEDLRTLFNSERIQEERQRFESSEWLKKR
mgnify:CR=1 FL=1